MLRRLFGINIGMPRCITFLSFVLTILLPQVALAQARVSGGDNFTLLVTDTGSVWSFGTNSNGQLGLGHFNDAKSPTQIPGLSGVVAVAAGGFHSLALTSLGTCMHGATTSADKLATSPILIAQLHSY